jgi:hypothetical protein
MTTVMMMTIRGKQELGGVVVTGVTFGVMMLGEGTLGGEGA